MIELIGEPVQWIDGDTGLRCDDAKDVCFLKNFWQMRVRPQVVIDDLLERKGPSTGSAELARAHVQNVATQ